MSSKTCWRKRKRNEGKDKCCRSTATSTYQKPKTHCDTCAIPTQDRNMSDTHMSGGELHSRVTRVGPARPGQGDTAPLLQNLKRAPTDEHEKYRQSSLHCDGPHHTQHQRPPARRAATGQTASRRATPSHADNTDQVRV